MNRPGMNWPARLARPGMNRPGGLRGGLTRRIAVVAAAVTVAFLCGWSALGIAGGASLAVALGAGVAVAVFRR